MNQFEISILLWIQENLRGVLDGFWVFITHLGDGGYLWIAIGIALLFFKKTRPVGISVLLALLINLFITNIGLKNIVVNPIDFCLKLEFLHYFALAPIEFYLYRYNQNMY